MKAFQKGQNAGTMFRLDLDVMKANKINAESYVRIWITAWHSKLDNDELEIAKTHNIMWYGQQVNIPDGYPPSGIPSSNAQLLVLAQQGKCGKDRVGLANMDNATAAIILASISGDTINDPDEDYYKKATKIRKAMDKFRHYATVALGPKLAAPFDQGLIKNYDN